MDRTGGPAIRALIFILYATGLMTGPAATTAAPAPATTTAPAAATPAPRDPSAAPLRVMSFNLRYGTADDGDHAWPHRAPLVLARVTEFAPDLLGTQECLAFQRDQLLGGLSGYAVVAAGRDDGAEAGEMCAAFYRADRLVLRASGTFWLSETPQEVASRGWDAALPRIATWSRLHDRSTGHEILWLNTHLDHAGEKARRKSAALLHRWLAEHRQGAVLVVTGDFNAPASDRRGSVQQTLRLGPAAAGSHPTAPALPLLIDTWTAIHDRRPEAGTFHGFGDAVRPGRIDWVLASPEARVRDATLDSRRTDGLWPSDHLPVTAVLVLEGD